MMSLMLEREPLEPGCLELELGSLSSLTSSTLNSTIQPERRVLSVLTNEKTVLSVLPNKKRVLSVLTNQNSELDNTSIVKPKSKIQERLDFG